MTSTLFEHCNNMYHAMHERATMEDDRLVYEGKTTQLLTSVGISIPYYSHVMKALQRMGCVEQLRRGGGPTPSRWALWKEPSEEDFEAAVGPIRRVSRENTDVYKRINALEEELKAVKALLGGINVPQALATLATEMRSKKAS